jgi:LL-diaminopimelate aminotransferase
MLLEPSRRLKNVGEYYFSRKLDQVRKMRAGGIDVINLGIGSPDLMPSNETLLATENALGSEKNHGYGSYRSTPELRKAMSDFYLRTYGVNLNSDSEILPLLGSKEGILFVMMAFLNSGDRVLIPNPGYPAYASVANLLDLEVQEYDLLESRNWFPDFRAIEKTDLSKTKLMWVNYPSMPTGQAPTAEFFTELIAFARRNQILICHDNPYSLVLNAGRPLSLLEFDPKMEVSLEMNSLSKSFNMAGWRVGMVAGSKSVIDTIAQVKTNIDSGMFLPVQIGAIAALSNSIEWHEERNQTYRNRRNLVFQIFDLLGFTYSKSQVGLFVWAKAPDSVAKVEDFLERILLEANVFLTPGMIFGTNGTRYARSSLCASESILKEAFERIQKWSQAR